MPTDRKTELLHAFTSSLGPFVTEGLKGLNLEKALLVSAAHERGTGTLRIIVDTSPIAIAVFLLPVDETLPAVELFTVHGDLPSGGFN